MAIVSYPLNDTVYQAEDAMLLNLPISSGVYGQEGNFDIDVSDMNITIRSGLAFMRYSLLPPRGFTLYSDSGIQFTLDNSDTVLARIDRIVLRWQAAQNSVTMMVLKGTPSSTPTAVARSTTSEVYDLVLYDILINANATSINAADITDQRLNPELCGLMASQVTQIDTTAINNQISELIAGQENTIRRIASETTYAALQDPSTVELYKPVRGIDYWTQQDQDDIVAEVLRAFTDVSEVGQ